MITTHGVCSFDDGYQVAIMASTLPKAPASEVIRVVTTTVRPGRAGWQTRSFVQQGRGDVRLHGFGVLATNERR